MRKRDKIYIAIASVLIITSIINLVVFYYESQPLKEKNMGISLRISNTTGFNLDNNSITFGNIVSGSSMKRDINIRNSYGFPITVYFVSEGNITRFLSHPYNISVDPGVTKEVSFNATIPLNENRSSFYSGNVEISMWEKE